MAASPLDGKSHYIIAPSETGWCITIRRKGRPVEITDAATRPEAARITRRLARDGLVGLDAAPEPDQGGRYARARTYG